MNLKTKMSGMSSKKSKCFCSSEIFRWNEHEKDITQWDD